MSRILVVVVGMLAFSSVHAEWLYWQIDSENLAEKVTPYAKSIGVVWDTATLSVLDAEGNTLTTLATAANAIENEAGSYDGATAGQVVDLGNYYKEGYSYYIELANTSSATQPIVVGKSTTTYAEMAGLVSDGEINIETVAAAAASPWHGSSTYNAPEPTSAVLMLLGVAGLALRRKQRIA